MANRYEFYLQVASFGAYLLKRDILTMSFAPRDTHEAQVQFALERGVPAMIGVMATRKLPYPARAFDMAHCSRCLIPWYDYGKLCCKLISITCFHLCIKIPFHSLHDELKLVRVFNTIVLV